MSASKEKIRTYCKDRYINPARTRGDSHVTVRSSEVINAFGLEESSELVYEALWSVEFELENNLFRVSNNCQKNSRISNLVFKVLPEQMET